RGDDTMAAQRPPPGGPMPTLVVARMASAAPMGMQRYEAEVLSRAASALASGGASDWQVRDLVVRSLRSPLAGDRLCRSAGSRRPPAACGRSPDASSIRGTPSCTE
ncbi:MAG: hypothetical protein ABI131_01795, partial [Nostocoides sp.]